MSVSVPEIDRVAPDDARRRQADGAMFVDVRSHQAFVDRHVDGARSVPADVIAGGRHGLPKDRELILYWTWAGEGSAARAAAALKNQGYTRVAVLKGGLAGWADRGYPTAAGEESGRAAPPV